MSLSKKDLEELESAVKRHPAKGPNFTRVHTETGSVYEFDFDNHRVRRANHTGNFKNMRKDEQWIQLVTNPQIVVGQSMQFALMGVAEDPNMVTFRTTSYVTKIV